jgi:L-iditol 2-dehydrogenase
MKAAILRGPNRVEFGERPDPVPQVGEALVQVRAVGICGSDLHIYRHGGFGDIVVDDLVQGHEPAGEVVAVGAGVQHLKPGDRVAIEPGIYCGCCEPCLNGRPNICPDVKYLSARHVDGAFCEYLARPEKTLLKLPENLSFEEGALLEPLAVSIHAVRTAGLRLGDHVAIVGAGSIGLTLLQAARCAGATRVYVFDRLDHRLTVAKKLGADEVGNVDRIDPLEALSDWTNGRLCDRVFEAGGQPESYALAVNMPALGGTVVLVGLCAEEVSLPLGRVRLGEVNILSLRREAHAYKAAMELVESGRIDVKGLISHRFPLERIGEAMAVAGSYRDNAVKVLVNPT